MVVITFMVFITFMGDTRAHIFIVDVSIQPLLFQPRSQGLSLPAPKTLGTRLLLFLVSEHGSDYSALS